MNTIVARFVTRNDGYILIGSLNKDQTLLKPDYVYQITEYMGEMVITEVGQSIIPENNKDETEGKTFEFGNWCNRIDHIMESAGNHMLLSIEEYETANREDTE